jgi:hypothetical protein
MRIAMRLPDTERHMNAQELADRLTAKVAAAVVEKTRQTGIAADNTEKRMDDVNTAKGLWKST